MRFGFVTCVRLGLSCMEEIHGAGGRLDFALTLHDDLAPTKSGRAWLDAFCAREGVPLVKVRHVNDPDALAALAQAELDWLFIIGWSQIAGPEVLGSVRRGALGMHPTLLPEGRGQAAIPWAILKGLPETGVSLFQLDAGVDTGPILAQVRIPLAPRETAGTLYEKVDQAHRRLIREAWPGLASGRLQGVPQDPDQGSRWPKRRPEDGRLSLEWTVEEADRLVRAVTRPYPGAFLDQGEARLRIWDGRPGAEGRGLVLSFRDGCYLATDYEWVPLSTG